MRSQPLLQQFYSYPQRLCRNVPFGIRAGRAREPAASPSRSDPTGHHASREIFRVAFSMHDTLPSRFLLKRPSLAPLQPSTTDVLWPGRGRRCPPFDLGKVIRIECDEGG
jgi:hypothetical protein